MFTVFIAVCLIGTTVQQCQRDTALDWIVAPERQRHHGACFLHGQQYAAQSGLVTEGTFLKVFCVLKQNLPEVQTITVGRE